MDTDTVTKNEHGTLTLEMSIVLPIFIFMFLFIFGMFNIIIAQNMITHALVQSTMSVSLDPFLLERSELIGETATEISSGLSDVLLQFIAIPSRDSEYFASNSDWYKFYPDDTKVIKERFCAYFAGGSERDADTKLSDLGIENGIDGIDFTVNVSNKIMSATIEYELNLPFNFFEVGKIPIKQTIKQRLWLK